MPITRRTAVLSMLALPALPRLGVAAPSLERIKLGQPTTSLSFLKIFAARALDTFEPQGIDLEWAALPGGDPAVLAALDSGDIDLAAVGSDTALAAISKAQPFKMVYTLMGKLPYNLTVSNAFLAKSGVKPDDPIEKRLGVLKTAVIGVSALGGAQDRVARWFAVQAGIDPKDIKLAVIGSSPALVAALENGRIDAFVISPPASEIAEARGFGKILVHASKEIPGAGVLPSLVLVARSEPTPEVSARIVKTLRALDKASAELLTNTSAVSDKIQEKFFPKVEAPVIRASIGGLADGVGGNGIMTDEAAAALLKFSSQTGRAAPEIKDFWTNKYAEAAAK